MNRKLKELQERCEKLEKENEKLWVINKEAEIKSSELEKDYESLFTAKQATEKRLTETTKRVDHLQDLYWEWHDKYLGLYFRKIVHNKEKGTTVVWFENGEKIIVKRRKGAKDDVYTAVAYAIVEKLYGSNTRFKKCVEDVKI